MVPSERIVVVGGGFAGSSVVSALLERAQPGALQIDLLDREPDGAYDRLELTRAVRGEVHPHGIVRFDPTRFIARGVRFHGGATVHMIDRFRRLVHTDDRSLGYDRLILATGSSPYLPAIRGLLRADGSLHPGVFTLHTLPDTERLMLALSSARKVAVLGGGRFGIEAVEALCRRGLEVHLFHQCSRLMSSYLDEPASAMLQAKLDAAGAHIHLARRATAVLGDDNLRGLAFHDGGELDFDAVVLTTGIQPNTWLGYQCGLGVERGVVVEGRMRSIDDLRIHAIGECAQWRGAIHALPEQILDQAQVIAEHITAQHSPRRYVGFKQAALYQVMGLNLSTLGRVEARPEEDVIQLGEPGRSRYKKVVLRNGRLVGAILLGDIRQADNLSKLYDSKARLTRDAHHRLFELTMPSENEGRETRP